MRPRPPQLLTPEDVAEWLNTSTGYLAKLRSQGGGPPFTKFGRKVRYHPNAVARWLRARTVGVAPHVIAPPPSNGGTPSIEGGTPSRTRGYPLNNGVPPARTPAPREDGAPRA